MEIHIFRTVFTTDFLRGEVTKSRGATMHVRIVRHEIFFIDEIEKPRDITFNQATLHKVADNTLVRCGVLVWIEIASARDHCMIRIDADRDAIGDLVKHPTGAIIADLQETHGHPTLMAVRILSDMHEEAIAILETANNFELEIWRIVRATERSKINPCDFRHVTSHASLHANGRRLPRKCAATNP